MKSPFKRNVGSAAIEAELGRIEAKLADHHRQRSEKLQQLEEVKIDRRGSWDQADEVTNKLTARIRELTADVAVFDEAISDLRDAIAGAQERLRAAHEAEEREKTATAWETAAKTIDAHKADLEKGMALAARALQAIQAAIPSDVALVPIYARDRPRGREEGWQDHLSAREIASAIAVECLAHHCPDLLDRMSVETGYQAGFAKLMTVGTSPTFKADHAQYDALAPASAVDALIITRLRKASENARRA